MNSDEYSADKVTISYHRRPSRPENNRLNVTRIKISKNLKKLIIKFSFDYSFYIRIGAGVEIFAPPQSIGDPIADYFLKKIVIPLSLALNGEVVLHASAFSLNEEGYLVIGKSGAGKSSLSLIATLIGGCHYGDDAVLLKRDNTKIFIVRSGSGALINEDVRNLIHDKFNLFDRANCKYNPFGNKYYIPDHELPSHKKDYCLLKNLIVLDQNIEKIENTKFLTQALFSSTFYVRMLKTDFAKEYIHMFNLLANKMSFDCINFLKRFQLN